MAIGLFLPIAPIMLHVMLMANLVVSVKMAINIVLLDIMETMQKPRYVSMVNGKSLKSVIQFHVIRLPNNVLFAMDK